jgi:hypothetical protein
MSNETDKEALKYGEDFFIEKLGVEDSSTYRSLLKKKMKNRLRRRYFNHQEV